MSPEVSQLLVESKKGLLDIGRVTDLTILFADIRNFTFLVQQLPPDKLRLFLNSFFEIYSSAVFANQGMLDKFIGDAALAIFGAPVKIENSVAAAVDSSLRIMKEFEQLRAEWEGESSVYREVGLGIGISKGPVFLGNVGSESRMDYTVIGTDVNIAQRLASETEAGQILITESVKDSLGGSYQLGMPKNLLIRGMKSEITVYSLIY